MNFSKTTSYALKILNHMAQDTVILYNAKNLHEILGVPYQYTRRLLSDLSKKGLVVSEFGRNGGFKLAKPPRDIYLAEIIDAVEGIDIMTKCIVGFENCPFDNHCAMHESWIEIRNNILKVLETTSLENFVKEHK
ncbi:MAG: Rrf2 family transcriptional regulator [Bacteroidales bacterium]|nr:Rrf2 family transcriptional regulator [Bacteroidales bacterium]MCF8406143.1 Rrf2 family transcriptional regulator [Bacteroidales bacterium]